ncbi:hypothetical protein [Paenibacillus sp. YN15]|uniref:hypothetical protein n=1 Tax=Paenibacillus sp. YN15 TaxID=1742774 RepID=UPI0011BF054F|nr:hypothetical protein [Paenibacillus sp. YN15]
MNGQTADGFKRCLCQRGTWIPGIRVFFCGIGVTSAAYSVLGCDFMVHPLNGCGQRIRYFPYLALFWTFTDRRFVILLQKGGEPLFFHT